jgi:cobalamin biosynthesis protein CbiD
MGDKSKERLKNAAAEEVTKLFESVLDYVQVACPTPDTYKVLRSKILRVGNNCIRVLKKQIDNYDVTFSATIEEVIEVKRPSK